MKPGKKTQSSSRPAPQVATSTHSDIFEKFTACGNVLPWIFYIAKSKIITFADTRFNLAQANSFKDGLQQFFVKLNLMHNGKLNNAEINTYLFNNKNFNPWLIVPCSDDSKLEIRLLDVNGMIQKYYISIENKTDIQDILKKAKDILLAHQRQSLANNKDNKLSLENFKKVIHDVARKHRLKSSFNLDFYTELKYELKIHSRAAFLIERHLCAKHKEKNNIQLAYNVYEHCSLKNRKAVEDLTQEDWNTAKHFFASNQKAVKYSNTESKIGCSFLKGENGIYAISAGKILGQGGFGRVKLAQDQSKNKYAVKTTKEFTHSESYILNALNQRHGTVTRSVPYRPFFQYLTNTKIYNITTYHPGSDLLTKLADFKKLTNEDKIKITYLTIKALNELHNKRIMHLDIKADNFMLNTENNQYSVQIIDFGNAIQLKPSEDHIEQQQAMSLDEKEKYFHLAPEYFSQTGEFSFKTDVYSLGFMLVNYMRIKDYFDPSDMVFINNMLQDNPVDRTNLNAILDHLENKYPYVLANNTTERKVEKAPAP